VTLIQNKQITAHVRFKGGITETLMLPRPLNSWEGRTTPTEVVTEIDRLLDHHTEKEIAGILNDRGTRSGDGKAFNATEVSGRLVKADDGLTLEVHDNGRGVSDEQLFGRQLARDPGNARASSGARRRTDDYRRSGTGHYCESPNS